MIALGEVQRRWAKRVGYPILGLVVFVFAVHYTFPYERIQGRLQEWAGDNYDVSIDSVKPGWLPGNVVLKGVTFRTRPTNPGEKVTEFTIDELDLDIALFSAIRGKYQIDLSAQIGAGKLSGHVVAGKTDARLKFHTSDMPLDNLPGVKTGTGGVPIKGGLDADLDVHLPKGKWKEAEGTISVACQSCTIGDGVAKIRPMAQGQRNAFSEGGMTLPKLKLGKIGGKIVIAKGIGKLESFEGHSSDGEVYIEGNIRFDDPFVRSNVTAYMRFKSSDELKKREPTMDDMEKFMGGQSKRADGYFGVSITGPFNALRFIGSKVSPVPGANEKTNAATMRPVTAAPRPDVAPVVQVPPAGAAAPNPNVPPNRPEPGVNDVQPARPDDQPPQPQKAVEAGKMDRGTPQMMQPANGGAVEAGDQQPQPQPQPEQPADQPPAQPDQQGDQPAQPAPAPPQGGAE